MTIPIVAPIKTFSNFDKGGLSCNPFSYHFVYFAFAC